MKGESRHRMNIVPYTPSTTITTLPRMLPQGSQGAALPGQAQRVYITLAPDYQFLLNKIIGWFSDREEVELIDHGTSDKAGLGYIIVEWYEYEVDQLFAAILRDEEIVADDTI